MTHHGHAAHYCSYAQARLPSFLSALLKRYWTQVTLVKVNIINSRLPCADMVCSLKAGLLCPGLPSHSSKSPVCHRRTWNIQRTDWRFLVTWDASWKGRVWQQPLEHCFKMFQTCAAIRSNTVRRKRIKEDQRGSKWVVCLLQLFFKLSLLIHTLLYPPHIMRMHYLLKRQLKPYWEGMWQHLPTSAQVSQQLGTNTQLSRCLAFLIAPLLCQCLPQPDVLKKFSPRGPQISVNFYKYHSIATIYYIPIPKFDS